MKYVYTKKYQKEALSVLDEIEYYIKKNFNEMDFENARSKEYMQFQIDEMLKEIRSVRSLVSSKTYYSIN
jgi:hypothetical protein